MIILVNLILNSLTIKLYTDENKLLILIKSLKIKSIKDYILYTNSYLWINVEHVYDLNDIFLYHKLSELTYSKHLLLFILWEWEK